MMTVGIVAMAGASLAFWWFCLRKGTKTVDDREGGQKPDRENEVSAKMKGFDGKLGTKWFAGLARPSSKGTARPESKGESIGGDAVVEEQRVESGKDALAISVLEVTPEEPLEPCTPKGTNAEVHEEGTV
jgi:hypothetical protein